MVGYSLPDDEDGMGDYLGPGHIDSQLRVILQLGWMILPEDRKTIDELEKLFRPMVDRAFKDMRDDADAFGLNG